MVETNTVEAPVEAAELHLTAEEQADVDRTVEAFLAEAEKPAPLEDSFSEKNLRGFVLGEQTLAHVLGISAEEAYGIAEVAYNLAENGKVEDAIGLAEGLLLTNPFDPYLQSLLASFYLRQERADEALTHYGLALDLDEDDLGARVNRGEILLNQGKVEEALKDFEHAIGLDPDGEQPVCNRARMLVAVTTQILQEAIDQKPARADA